MSQERPLLALVIPCYNEEAILLNSARLLLAKLQDLTDQNAIAQESYLLLVDDGSKDRTWSLIQQLHEETPEQVYGLKLAANRGHQNALLAGLHYVRKRCDAAISMDADLQDDIDTIDRFIEEYAKGNDIVFGVRNDRSSDSFAKRTSAELFYKLLAFLGVNVIFNHADFRLMSRRTLKALAKYDEVNLYLRGIVSNMGFPSTSVYYTRHKADRSTHYSLPKMLNLAWDGITSFSIRPIRLITILGLITICVCTGIGLWALFCHFTGKTIPGWSSLLLVILAGNGLQFLAIGCIGEYTGKTYLETKHRPKYQIDHILNPRPMTSKRKNHKLSKSL